MILCLLKKFVVSALKFPVSEEQFPDIKPRELNPYPPANSPVSRVVIGSVAS